MYDPRIGEFLSEDPIGFDGGDENLSRFVNNAPTIYTDPDGLQKTGQAKPAASKYSIKDSGVKLAVTFQIGASFLGSERWGVPTHGFLILGGKGYGFFEKDLNVFGTGDLRDDDETGYPLKCDGMAEGSFYRLEAPITIDANEHDPAMFRQYVMKFIKEREKDPGTYATLGRNCFQFVGDAVAYGLEESRIVNAKSFLNPKGRTKTELYYLTKHWTDLKMYNPK